MKKIVLGACILFSLATMLSVSGQDEKIPIVWKNPAKNFREGQCYAFGFSQDENAYKFLLQIKALDKLLANENAELAEGFGVKQAPTLVVVKDGQASKYAGVSDIKKLLNV